jgi:hypothetical protein
MFRHYPYSKAWRLAVDLWAEENSILPEDHERVLKSVPDPEQFKRLRRQMNEREGCDVPVECLRPVFKEQRETLALSRLNERARELDLSKAPSPQQPVESAADDILSWFERESA